MTQNGKYFFRSTVSCGGIGYETPDLLSPVVVKRAIDADIFRWGSFGVCNLSQQSYHRGRHCPQRAYEYYGICSAAVSDWSRLFCPLSLRFPVLCFPQAEDTGAQVSALSAESCFIPGYRGGYGSVNDTSFQLVN